MMPSLRSCRPRPDRSSTHPCTAANNTSSSLSNKDGRSQHELTQPDNTSRASLSTGPGCMGWRMLVLLNASNQELSGYKYQGPINACHPWCAPCTWFRL
jgi:hypothetical protein